MPDIASINGVNDLAIASRNGIIPRYSLGSVTSLSAAISVGTGNFGVIKVGIAGGRAAFTNPNWAAECTLADGTVTVADSNIDRDLAADLAHVGGTLVFTDTNASTAQRTFTAYAQEFGDKVRSGGSTANYTPAFAQHKFIRIQGCDDDGTPNNIRLSFREIRLFTGTGQSGDKYPEDNLTSNTSETGIVISAGAFFNDTYAPYKAFGSNSTNWWTLGNTNAALNYIQIEFEDGTYGTKPIIKSIMLNKHYDTNIAKNICITGSDNADHSSATDYGVYLLPDKINNSDVSEFDIG